MHSLGNNILREQYFWGDKQLYVRLKVQETAQGWRFGSHPGSCLECKVNLDNSTFRVKRAPLRRGKGTWRGQCPRKRASSGRESISVLLRNVQHLVASSHSPNITENRLGL